MATSATPPPDPVKDTIDDLLLLSALREEGKAELLEILDSIRGRKCIVTDAQIGGLLSQIIVEGPKFLSGNDVDYLRDLKDEGLRDFTTQQQQTSDEGHQRAGASDIPENIIYIVRPHLPLMNLIANQINEAAKSGKGLVLGSVVALFSLQLRLIHHTQASEAHSTYTSSPSSSRCVCTCWRS